MALVAILALAVIEMVFLFAPDRMVFDLADAPALIGRKSDDVTANFNARSRLPAPVLRPLRFRANGGPWENLGRGSPRLGRGHVLIEIHADKLRPRANNLDIELQSLLGLRRTFTHPFHYHEDMPDFPIISDWERGPPEVQDGFWDIIKSDTLGYSIRPRLGHEGYDRFVLIAPPFQGSRRVTVDMRFAKATGALHGFGVLPFWGGHLDPEGRFPRRGWEYGLAWYYSVQGGFGVEFSRKSGSDPHATDRIYRPHHPTAGDAFRIVVEAFDANGVKSIRLKTRPLPHGAFGEWIELTDISGHLKGDRYAVGLIAHRAQVEFGKATVEKIEEDAFHN
ncbi:MAG: hypothetical protein OQK05_03820 [Pseudopelagicola sp.]|nr:hypothetical protein [Pseudopelagicola sp.]